MLFRQEWVLAITSGEIQRNIDVLSHLCECSCVNNQLVLMNAC